MRKIICQGLLFLVFLSLIFVVCVGDSPRHNESSRDCDAGSCRLDAASIVVEVKDISQDNWSLTLFGNNWSNENPFVPEVKFVSRNLDKKCTVILAKNPTADSYEQHVAANIKMFMDAGYSVSSVEQVVVNQVNFVKVQVSSDSKTMWAWLTVKDGFGYGFSCGGSVDPDAGSSLHDLCQDTANTLEVK